MVNISTFALLPIKPNSLRVLLFLAELDAKRPDSTDIVTTQSCLSKMLNIGRNRVKEAFKDLEDKGFIKQNFSSETKRTFIKIQWCNIKTYDKSPKTTQSNGSNKIHDILVEYGVFGCIKKWLTDNKALIINKYNITEEEINNYINYDKEIN